MAGVTLDTGVFIAVERRQRRALALWEKWALNMTALTAPAVVIAECGAIEVGTPHAA